MPLILFIAKYKIKEAIKEMMDHNFERELKLTKAAKNENNTKSVLARGRSVAKTIASGFLLKKKKINASAMKQAVESGVEYREISKMPEKIIIKGRNI
ncbi:hypothetical protein HK44_019335 [Pseudomonas fluorescens HK44]|uniref:Uncharacterized protein n=1 Tax=Pseudomonas fluorescens HK44 TaxID=1042209 RepID=A0A010SDP7_PSEFL|nr:hypothetical protein [Pseudomonas fluorescens]EXF91325.1 hypothetical protein HK44_019335 [Pseudomonas fluorescens HK44]